MRLLVSTAAIPSWRCLAAVSALWISTMRLFVSTRTAVAALAIAAVLGWRSTVRACLVLTPETTLLLAAMWLLSVVATWWVVGP